MSIYKFKIKLLKNYHPTSGDSKLLVEKENLHPKPCIYENDGRRLVILGSPIYCNKINNKAVSRKLFETGINTSLVSKLDGSFLLIWYDEKQSTLTVVNDRFASIPFYYYSDKEKYIGSVN